MTSFQVKKKKKVFSLKLIKTDALLHHSHIGNWQELKWACKVVLAEWETKQVQSLLFVTWWKVLKMGASVVFDRLLSGNIAQLNFSSDFYFKLSRVWEQKEE